MPLLKGFAKIVRPPNERLDVLRKSTKDEKCLLNGEKHNKLVSRQSENS